MRACCLFVLLAACGDDGTAPPDATLVADALPRETVTEDKLLLAGELAEATLTGGPGDHAVITLTAPVAKLDWNLHGHANGQTQVVTEELAIASTTYFFAPPADAAWSLLLRNTDTMPLTVNVTVELYGDLAWTNF